MQPAGTNGVSMLPVQSTNSTVVIDFISADATVTIGATVPSGLEFSAHAEIKEKINITKSETAQGKVYFQTTVKSLPQLHKLRSVDRLFLVIKTFKGYIYDEDRNKAIIDLQALAPVLPWEKVVKFWNENLKYQKKRCSTKKSSHEITKKTSELHLQEFNQHPSELSTIAKDSKSVRFRASANRIGKKQSITSPDAETHFGGAVQDCTEWKVDLTNYNFEVLITLGTDFVMVACSLTQESLHRRNITDFAYTTLRASIAYNMLRMCDIQAGEIVIDPMCGSGAIPIEGCQEWTNAFYIAGDNSPLAVKKCRSNVKHLNAVPEKQNTLETIRWDVRHLPLPSDLVDVFITDLPFGKRVGTKMDNRTLYPQMLCELARVSRTNSSRACILTNDKRSILKAISLVSSLWKLKRTASVNIGGLRAAVYLLRRTGEVVFK